MPGHVFGDRRLRHFNAEIGVRMTVAAEMKVPSDRAIHAWFAFVAIAFFAAVSIVVLGEVCA